jgi:hypothetical protein
VEKPGSLQAEYLFNNQSTEVIKLAFLLSFYDKLDFSQGISAVSLQFSVNLGFSVSLQFSVSLELCLSKTKDITSRSIMPLLNLNRHWE